MNTKSYLLVCIVLGSMVVAGISAPCPVAKTGQASVYRFGDDGNLKPGTAWPRPRFTDNGGGTVTDNLTGLEWVQEPLTWRTTWNNAIDYCNDLVYAECSDWRLPNVAEFQSLMHHGRGSWGDQPHDWLNSSETPFSSIQSYGYWSSETSSFSTSRAMYVSMASVGSMFAADKQSAFYLRHVWPVRGGKSNSPSPVPKTGQTTSYRLGDDGDLQSGTTWPGPRFTDNGNGTVTDNLTGLEWMRDPHGLAGNFGASGWAYAVDFCRGLNYAENSDWRLPSYKELMSLVVYWQNNPALPSGHPFIDVDSNNYWSSTTAARDANIAECVKMSTGQANDNNKTNSLYAWPVRDNFPDADIIRLLDSNYSGEDGPQTIKDIQIDQGLVNFSVAVSETGRCCLAMWKTNIFDAWSPLIDFNATTPETGVSTPANSDEALYTAYYFPWDFEYADQFDYPIGVNAQARADGILEFPDGFYDETNDLYPNEPTDSPLREQPSGSGWHNTQDVGAYYYAEDGIHPGEDWNYGSGRDDVGMPVFAVANGIVEDISPLNKSSASDAGYAMVIRHFHFSFPKGTIYDSVYVHIAPSKKIDGSTNVNIGFVEENAESAFDFQEGQFVPRGAQIGVIASATLPSLYPYPHLHFEMRDKAVPNLPTKSAAIAVYWPRDNGNVYYGIETTASTMSAQAVSNAYTLMQADGIIDPSDFIDTH